MDILTPAKEWAKVGQAAGSGDAHEQPLTVAQKVAVFLGVTVPFASLVAAIVIFWNRGVTLLDVGLLVGMYSLTVIGICVGFHRLLTHRAFETTTAVKALLAVAGSMSLQGPVIKWCAIHRRHHQESDSEGDPHSPHAFGTGPLAVLRGMWHSHVGWVFEGDPPDIARSVSDLAADRVLLFIDRTFFLWFVVGLAIPTGIAWVITGTAWGALGGFLWGGLVRTCVMHHATWSVNSVCHVWGTRPYKSGDESRNNPVCGLICFGEGWHNNHHAFPSSARHGLAWWQIDISWLFILGLKACGLAWNIRLPSVGAMRTKRRVAEAAEGTAGAGGVTVTATR